MPEMSKLIPLGAGLAAWSRFTYRSPVSFTDREGKGQQYDVEADVVFEKGRFVCDRLAIRRRGDGPPVTTEGLREIAVATLLHVAVESNVMYVTPTGEPGEKMLTWPWLLLPSEDARTGGGPTDEDIRNVATLYQVAYAVGEPPTKTVMDRFGLPRSTASRWIRMAREQGLLGPATPRKAGG